MFIGYARVSTGDQKQKSNTIDDICRTLRVGRSTLYRYLAAEKRQ